MKKKIPEHIILFDGICNLCNSSVNFIIKRDGKAKFAFSSLQSETGKYLLNLYGLKTENFDSVVLISQGKIFQKSDAALKITQMMDKPWNILHIFFIIPKSLRDKIYSLIAKYRYQWFGKRKICSLPSKALKTRFFNLSNFI